MIEKQQVNNKDVWIKVDPHPVGPPGSETIPNEYFTTSYYLQDPDSEDSIGILMKDENGEVSLYESPVEALTSASKKLENIIG